MISYKSVNTFLSSIEAKQGRARLLIIITVCLFVAACLYVRPGTNYIGHGTNFEKLTYNLLDLRNGNPLGYRVLTPAIAQLVGLQGRPFIIINLVFAFITIGAIYQYFRKKCPDPADALVGATCLTFSSVILVTIFYSGFCDAFTYLAIFLMYWSRHKWYLFYPLFLAAILNHESAAFLVPWLIYLKLGESSHKGRALLELVVGFGIVIAVVAYFRHWLSGGQNIGMDTLLYTSPLKTDLLHYIKIAYPYQLVGLFTVFKALWVFPLVAAWSMWKNQDRFLLGAMLLPMLCAGIQLLIAYDSTRMLTVGFMTMIIALEYLIRTNAFEFKRWALFVIAFNLLIPQLFTAAKIIEIMTSTPVNLTQMLIDNRSWCP